jgi:hypothetical protein
MNDKIKTLIQIFKHLKSNYLVHLLSYDGPKIMFLDMDFFNGSEFTTRTSSK